ncbi:1-phosphofructokinase family hexose kinase [Streptomyces sp. 4R-3d]|uniref:1-phosphofructokinase family hexose kinase n=1 Tax=Streptomyces sp. 4R-3d TaxID=2559605 RepID=UPI00107281D0|nr:1-phosphofructokinase family hexose kinase [Streptomyces sp. 4R-3d]TFI28141.1 1-phosphofructokinase family hexose kinase [Streptomyces sp. 4R-3d]
MILTVTLNTALDITYRTAALTPHATNRVAEVTERPGGKGINVARVLAALGHESVVTGFVGGRTGDALRELLAAEGPGETRPGDAPVTDALVPIAGTTRRTIAVVDETTGDTTQLNEPGPTVTPAEWAAFLTSYEGLAARADAVALCGSLPPGIHVGAYAELVRLARAARRPVLLDTSGEPLRRGIAARPDLVKPNADELAQLTGSREPLRATRDARRRGGRSVVASLGAAGLLAATPDGSWRAAPPTAVRGNPTGAGDSAVAGLLSGLVERLPWPERLARAVALSAATVLAPTAGEFDREAYADLLPRVAVTEQSSQPEQESHAPRQHR